MSSVTVITANPIAYAGGMKLMWSRFPRVPPGGGGSWIHFAPPQSDWLSRPISKPEGALQSESIQSYSYTVGSAGAAGPLGLLPDEKATLDRHRQPVLGTVWVA